MSPSWKGRLLSAADETCGSMPAFVREPILAGLSHLPYHRMLPRFVMIEPTNACNLSCPLCPVGARVMTRARAFMPVEPYRALIGELRGFVRRIVMNFAGEPCLHPHIGELVAIAESSGIAVTLGTNGMVDRSKELLQAGTSEILFALDGTTQETYATYRRGGNLVRVLENLGKLTEGNRRNGGHTRIVLQFVVMKHNEGQIDDLIRIAEQYGVDEVSLTPVIVNDFFEESKRRLVDRYLPDHPEYRQYRVRNGQIHQTKPVFCVWVFQSVILHNGDVSACCFDYDGTTVAGNAFASGFLPVWRNAVYRKLRAGVVRHREPICRTCDFSTMKPLRIPIAKGAGGRTPAHAAQPSIPGAKSPKRASVFGRREGAATREGTPPGP